MKQIRHYFALALVVAFAACSKDTTAPGDVTNPPPETPKTESDVFLAGARLAWIFVENNTQASTGLAQAHDNFQYVTTWDIASQIGATYSAHELGIIDNTNYDTRIKKILATLTTLPLYQGAAFNRFYDSKTGQMVDRNFNASTTGFGWSTTDIGRLLTWLRVLAVNQPQYSAQATAIKNRLNMSRLISGERFRAWMWMPTGTRSRTPRPG